MALVVVAVAAAVVPVKGPRNERAHKKGGCALGAAALYCRRPQSAFAGAVCLHDGGNGTALATRL